MTAKPIKTHTFWLPHAVNEEIFKPYGEKSLDVLMTGDCHRIYPIRGEMIELLKHKPYFTRIVRKLDKKDRLVDNPRLTEYAKLISSAKIHPTCTSILGYVVAKFMEIPACDTLLLSDYIGDMKDLGFIPGYNFIKYKRNKFLSTVEYYLKNDEERKQISKNGLALIQQRHTASVRTEEFVQTLNDLFKLSNPNVLFLTRDRTHKTAQNFNLFQQALAKTSWNITFLIRPRPIPPTTEYDLVLTDNPFSTVREDWAKIKCIKGAIIEDLHGESPLEAIQNMYKFGVDFIAYKYKTPFINHKVVISNEYN